MLTSRITIRRLKKVWLQVLRRGDGVVSQSIMNLSCVFLGYVVSTAYLKCERLYRDTEAAKLEAMEAFDMTRPNYDEDVALGLKERYQNLQRELSAADSQYMQAVKVISLICYLLFSLLGLIFCLVDLILGLIPANT